MPPGAVRPGRGRRVTAYGPDVSCAGEGSSLLWCPDCVRGESEEVVRVFGTGRCAVRQVQDHVALDEIELYGELMIAASTAVEERLSPARIDEVLRVARDPERAPCGRSSGRSVPRGPQGAV